MIRSIDHFFLDTLGFDQTSDRAEPHRHGVIHTIAMGILKIADVATLFIPSYCIRKIFIQPAQRRRRAEEAREREEARRIAEVRREEARRREADAALRVIIRRAYEQRARDARRAESERIAREEREAAEREEQEARLEENKAEFNKQQAEYKHTDYGYECGYCADEIDYDPKNKKLNKDIHVHDGVPYHENCFDECRSYGHFA